MKAGVQHITFSSVGSQFEARGPPKDKALSPIFHLYNITRDGIKISDHLKTNH